MDLQQITADVYACLQEDRGLGCSNSGLIDAGGGLVVDTFWDLPRTRQMMSLYASVLPSVPERVVNTHHNGDHCWGNQLFADAGSEIIGHRLCAEHMTKEIAPELLQGLLDAPDLSGPLAGFAAGLRSLGFDFRDITVTPPTHLIEDELALDLDRIEVVVRYVGPAHTAGDVIVHLPSEGVVYTGDILFNRCTPIGWEGTYASWLSALDRIVELDPAVVVPGHGPIGTTDDVRAMGAYLEYVYEASREHHDAGLSILDAAKKIDLGPYASWTEPERLAFNVARAFREFRGGAWDEPLDLGEVFAAVAELRDHYAAA